MSVRRLMILHLREETRSKIRRLQNFKMRYYMPHAQAVQISRPNSP